VYFLADEKHSRCLTAKVYLPTIVSGRLIWHLGDTKQLPGNLSRKGFVPIKG